MKLYQLKPWNQCHALVVNDDGIDAEGIKVLEELARGLFAKVTVVAPAHEHSGMGHAISYKKKFKYEQRGADHYAVHGTPADSTIVGLNLLMKDNPPDIVLSGINHGDNAGNAIAYSGTFGGALEAGLAGIPGVAFSQLRQNDRSMDFTVSRKYFSQVMAFLQTAPWPDHVVMNVNFPPVDNHTHDAPHHVPARAFHIIDGMNVEVQEDGKHNVSIRMIGKVFDPEGHHDHKILSEGGVSITPIMTNWTCHETLKLWTTK